MRISLAVLTALMAVMVIVSPARGADQDGVALAILYDTSGSMKDPVPDKDRKPTPKYVIANRALISIAEEIQRFATNATSGEARKVEAGLFVFESPGAREAVRFGPFDRAAMVEWARTFASPSGGTPLGNALSVAARAVFKSHLSRKHVLIITDGISNTGPAPAAVIPRLKQQAAQSHADFSVHFVAFDVAAKVFDPVKQMGATVVGASDEKQLDNQLEFILQKKILLEEEEPAKK